MKINAAGATHQGRHRPSNQDYFLVDNQLRLYAVADGVESGPFGNVASEMAIKALRKIINDVDISEDTTPPFDYAKGIPTPARALKFALREVNRILYKKAHEDPKLLGMGTTTTALWIVDDKAYIGHVGDSRSYLVRKGQIQQLTRDHTSLAEGDTDAIGDGGFLEQFSSGSEHELTRVLAINSDIEVQLAGGTPQRSDIFILCTDGLYGELNSFEIQDSVIGQDPAVACKKLIQLANQRGGKDNMAAVVIKID